MSLATYLVQRGKRGTWQLRVPVPRALHAPGKPKERVRSMGTTDRRIASDRALAVLDEWKREWAQARGDAFAALAVSPPARPKPTEAQLKEAAVAVAHDLYLEDAAAHRRGLLSLGQWAHEIAIDNAHVEAGNRAYAHAAGIHTDAQAEAILAGDSLGLDIPPGSAEYEKLCEFITAVKASSARADARRAEGYVDVETDSRLVQEVRAREAAKAKPGETLLQLFDRYAEQRQAEEGKRADTLTQDRKVIEQFTAFIGADRAVASIKPEHVREYRDAMRQLPPKWRDRADMRGLTMREAVEKARAGDMPRVALTTINKHLSTISPLFAWLIEERWDLSNPCTGLFFKRVKGKNPRPPFGTERLNAVLASPLFTGFEADGKEHRPGEVRADDWRRWIPLLCLFTGMRVGEAAQLRTEDVSQHDCGAWVIDIHHKPEKGQTTKSGQSRASVAHKKLLGLGFVEFVARSREAGGDGRLFPELVANDRDQLGAEPSAFWRDYLTRIGVKSGADGLGAHSFRHELADRLRLEVGLVDDQIAVAIGHDQKSTTAGYGVVRQGTVRFLAPVMEQVRFDGVKFEI
jgi:integrase